MLKFICYPKCTTCLKAKKWLDDNKIDYEHIEESLKPELNMFNKRRITDYYYDVNFCNINLVCYVKK